MENSSDNKSQVPEGANDDMELLIDDYLDGRMDLLQRAKFDARMNSDPALRDRVMSATRSIALVQRALGWITPDDKFDNDVNSKINSITQSGEFLRVAGERSLTSDDPEAKLLGDPVALRERRRLITLGIIVALLFSLAAGTIIYSMRYLVKPSGSEQK